MSEPAERSEAARLDELAAVTKGYGRYFGPSSGFALSITGAWLLACEWGLRASPTAGQVLFALAPAVWIVVAPWARSYYQRHGEVVIAEPDMGLPYRAIFPVLLVFFATDGIMNHLRGPTRGYTFLLVVAFVAIPALAARVARSQAHLTTAVALTMFAAGAQGDSHHDAWFLGCRLAYGPLLVVAGIIGHWRYRRLERRLAALKGATP